MLSMNRTRRTSSMAAEASPPLPPFRNEPVTDFARVENRQAMAGAIEDVRRKLGQNYRLLIAGEEIRDRGTSSRLARSRPELAAWWVELRWPVRMPRMPSPRHGRPLGRGGQAPPAGRGVDEGGRALSNAGSSWPRGRFSSAASPGARPTPTSPRRSISASSTPGR